MNQQGKDCEKDARRQSVSVLVVWVVESIAMLCCPSPHVRKPDFLLPL